MVDIKALHSLVLTLFREVVDGMLPETSGLEDGGNMLAEG
jgi:hypothetical protein